MDLPKKWIHLEFCPNTSDKLSFQSLLSTAYTSFILWFFWQLKKSIKTFLVHAYKFPWKLTCLISKEIRQEEKINMIIFANKCVALSHILPLVKYWIFKGEKKNMNGSCILENLHIRDRESKRWWARKLLMF